MEDEYGNESFHTPLLHLLLHVDALFLQQLPLSKGPVDRFCWGLCTWGPLSLQASLLWVIKAEHMAFPHDDTVSWEVHITAHTSDKTLLILLVFSFFFSLWKIRQGHRMYLTAEQWDRSLSFHWHMSLPLHTAPRRHILSVTNFTNVKQYANVWMWTWCFRMQWRPWPSPWGPVVLLKVQCSSLIKWPLRTMSWRVLAFSRPTLGRSRKINNSSFPCNGTGHLVKMKGLKTYLVMPSLM